MTEKRPDTLSEKQAETEQVTDKKPTEGTDELAAKQPSEQPEAEQELINKETELQKAIKTLETALTKEQEAHQKTKDLLLRVQADAQNTKRRAEQDVAKTHKFALSKFAEALLPVIDSMESSLVEESADETVQAMKKGMELTLKLFLDTLKKFNIEQVAPENGEPFNPDYHQAISQTEAPETEPGSIINVFQKGYVLNNRLIRPAMVIVSK